MTIGGKTTGKTREQMHNHDEQSTGSMINTPGNAVASRGGRGVPWCTEVGDTIHKTVQSAEFGWKSLKDNQSEAQKDYVKICPATKKKLKNRLPQYWSSKSEAKQKKYGAKIRENLIKIIVR